MENSEEKSRLEGPVQLKITGGQGELTTSVTARCYYKNKSYYLLFEEAVGEDDRKNAIVFSSRLKISEDRVTLRRSLSGEEKKTSRPVMEMVYRETGRDEPGHFLDYPTPYGKLYMEIRTDRLLIEETQEGLTVKILYRLLQEGKEVSRDRIIIQINR